MNRRPQMYLVLCLFLSGGIGFGSAAWSAVAPGPNLSSLRTLNDLAAPSLGADPFTVRRLVDTVFDTTLDLPAVPAFQSAAEDLKDRLVRAELKFRAKSAKGIPEGNVVLVVNGLAAKLGAPDYAKSSRYEVRKMRGSLLGLYPNLIRHTTSKLVLGVPGGGLSPEMSPVEAFVVLTTLLQQKRFNPDWQVTQAERIAGWYRKPSATPSSGPAVVANPRAAEVERKVAKSLEKMTPSDLEQLSHKALTLLGVAK